MKGRGKKLQTAVHEAAHFVIGEYLGVRASKLEVFQDGDEFRGFVRWDGRSYPNRTDRMVCAIICLSGSIAEHHFFGRPQTEWSEEDYMAAEGYARNDKRMAAAKQLAFSMVNGLQRQIFVVARGLVKNSKLSGKDARMLLGDSL